MDVGALGGAFADEREPFDINVGCGIGIDPVQVFFFFSWIGVLSHMLLALLLLISKPSEMGGNR